MMPSSQNFRAFLKRKHLEWLPKYFIPSLFASSSAFLGVPVAVLCIPILIGTLDRELYGSWILITLLLNQSHVLLFGAEKSVLYYVSKTNDPRYYFPLIIGCFLVTCSLFFFLFCLNFLSVSLYPYLTPKAIILISLGALTHMLWNTAKIRLIVEKKYGKMGLHNFLQLSSAIFIPSISVYFLETEKHNFETLLFWYVTFKIIILFFVLPPQRPTICFRIRDIKAAAQNIVSYGRWLGLSQTIQQVYESSDRVLLSIFHPMSLLPIYNVPLQLSQKLASIPQGLSIVIFSKLSKGESWNQNIIFWVTIILCALTTTIFQFNEIILQYWLQNSYSPDMLIVSSITLYAMVLASINFILLSALEASGHGSVSARIDLYMLAPMLILMFLLIYFFDIVGASCCLVIKEASIMLPRSMAVKKRSSLNFVFYIPLALLAIYVFTGLY